MHKKASVQNKRKPKKTKDIAALLMKVVEAMMMEVVVVVTKNVMDMIIVCVRSSGGEGGGKGGGEGGGYGCFG